MTKTQFDKFVKRYGTPLSIIIGSMIIAAAIYASGDSAGRTGISGETAARVEVSTDDDFFLGADDAPVTMIEFGDFQCPFCRSFWRETLPQIKEKYIDTGKVKFVYRDFPLSIHPAAQAAAESAECARDQGKFLEMHDKIFSEQDKQGSGTIEFDIDDLKKWAAEIGLASSPFESCLDSGKYKQEVLKDLDEGIETGVSGTPGFFINGRVVRGALPYEAFAEIIEQELAR